VAENTDGGSAASAEKLLLIVEDDESFARTLKRSFERRNYRVLTAASLEQVVELLRTESPNYAVVDLKLDGVSGLSCVQTLHAHDEKMNIVVLTGFASIATAVEAIKLGARHYLAKPSNTDDIENAFGKADGDTDVGPRPSRRWNGSASTRRLPTPTSTSPRPPVVSAFIAVRWLASCSSDR
jgi:two-component system response regulator RegA